MIINILFEYLFEIICLSYKQIYWIIHWVIESLSDLYLMQEMVDYYDLFPPSWGTSSPGIVQSAGNLINAAYVLSIRTNAEISANGAITVVVFSESFGYYIQVIPFS